MTVSESCIVLVTIIADFNSFGAVLITVMRIQIIRWTSKCRSRNFGRIRQYNVVIVSRGKHN